MARSTRGSGRRTDYAWNGVAGAITAVAAAKQRLNLMTFNQSGTLMRIRGNVSVLMDVGAASDILVVGLGIIIGTDVQVTAGSGSFPSPLSRLDADWIWHAFAPLLSETGTQSDDGSLLWQQEIDSKAMRKVRQNDNLVLVAESAQLVGTSQADVAIGVRALQGS